MDAAAEMRRNPVSKHHIQPEYEDEQADAKRVETGLPTPSRETKFSCANADREILISPVQLTLSWIGNLARLILALAICVAIHTVHTIAVFTWGFPSTYCDVPGIRQSAGYRHTIICSTGL